MDIRFIATRIALRTVCLIISFAATGAVASDATPALKPLPLEVVASQRSFTWNAAFDLSLDGKWLAYAFGAADEYSVGAGARSGYSATGVPMNSMLVADLSRRHIAVKELARNRIIEIGGNASWNWAPAWSPDSRRLAYFSDEGGTAGLWIWQNNQRVRIPDLIVRPSSLNELPRWSKDGRLVLCRVLPQGTGTAQANAPAAPAIAPGSPPRAAASAPSVTVLRSIGAATAPPGQFTLPRNAPSEIDLAIIEVDTRRVERIAKNANIRWYAFSPDQRHVAYAQTRATTPDDGLARYDVFVYDLATQTSRPIASELPLAYPESSWTWSPDSSRIGGFVSAAPGTATKIGVAAIQIASAELQQWTPKAITVTNYNQPLLWDSKGRAVYLIGFPAGAAAQLWKLDVTSGSESAVTEVPAQNVQSIVKRRDADVPWTPDGGRSLWILSRQHVLTTFHQVDVKTRRAAARFNVNNGYNDSLGATATGKIAYMKMDVRHPPDVWSFDVSSGRHGQLTRLNQAFDSYALGDSQLIEWRTAQGQVLHGALLLPPNYRVGQKLPLVLWTFGWEADSDFVSSFGFATSGQSPVHNLHALATRGYAVLFPDMSLRTGTQMADSLDSVMPGIDLLIERGYADPERLAVTGFSLGSYTVLAIIAQTPRFKAAISSGANIHPDLIADYVTSGLAFQSVESRVHGQRLSMGVTPWQNRDTYVNNSPFFFLDRITTPLLIGQGANDNVYPAYVLHSLMRDLHKELELRIYPGEGHEISQRDNVADFWRRRVEFLDEKLDIVRDAEGRMLFDQSRARSRTAVQAQASSPHGGRD